MTPHSKTTKDTQAPALFVEPGLLKQLVETTVRAILEEEVERHVGAPPHARSQQRRAHRNGYKPRSMKTCVGELSLAVPQVREGGFRTAVFERYQRSDKALVASMQEMVSGGVSTRRVADVLQAMGGFEVSPATVSRAMAELDAQIEAFFSRPLHEAEYPYLIVDARYEKARRDGRVRSLAVLIVAGIRDDGHRELLALETGDSESAQCWGGVFSQLRKRGLRGTQIVVSDAHAGIRAAIDRHLQGARWQRCKVHFMREMLGNVGSRETKEMLADLRAIYASEDRGRCLQVAGEIADKWQARSPKMAAALRAGVEATLEVWDLPRAQRRKLNSTNMIERVMRELKRRTRAIGAFTNEAACRRTIGARLLEMQDAWDCEPRRYFVPDQLTF